MINASTGNIRIMNSIEMLSWSLTFFLLSAPRTDPTIGIPYNPYRRVLSRYGPQGGPISGSPGQHRTSARPHRTSGRGASVNTASHHLTQGSIKLLGPKWS